ncbi:MAG: DNA repair protein RecO [Microscillaceae bacterium]|nr:DNA repair protein RecO [Microscillaceae bacterium]
MLFKTRGIVINYFKYSESSIIVRIYTEELGLQSYIVNGIRSSKSKNRMAFFQPLTMLELVVYFREDRAKINRISEHRCRYAFQSIPFDYRKSVVAMFIMEILTKTLQGEIKNPDLFEFIDTSLLIFDQMTEDYENFHLVFLLKLTRYLGFAPQNSEDIFEQIASSRHSSLYHPSKQACGSVLDRLLRADYSEKIKISGKQRSELIDYILEYFQIHIENFQVIKSLEIIRVMNH